MRKERKKQIQEEKRKHALRLSSLLSGTVRRAMRG
jgi:hypothetical protein